MKRRILTTIISFAVFSLCVLCLASCEHNENNNLDSIIPANISVHSKDIYVNKAQPLKFGYVSCYTNPQKEENLENKENSYGIMDSKGNVVVEPKYANAFPVSRETFSISTIKEGELYSSMIDGEGKTIIPSFKGEIVTVCHKDNATIAIIEPQGEKSYIVDMAGKKLFDLDFNSVYLSIETRQDVLEAYTDESAYYISLDGKIISEFPANKPIIDPFRESTSTTVICCCYSPEKLEGRILYGLYDSKNDREIVPCTRQNGFAISEERFVLKDTSKLGPDYDDFAAIYDKDGNIICDSGKYQDIIFSYGNSWGVGVTIKPTEDNMSSEVKYYKIDANGNMLSEALDSMPKLD